MRLATAEKPRSVCWEIKSDSKNSVGLSFVLGCDDWTEVDETLVKYRATDISDACKLDEFRNDVG
ncbi:hypothetical protein PM082_007542 [Marasmius tenuissimus]|nr:hypothetical protein PM082_007542 [Marasmius tenuissimus]